ncbi:MAG: hypothetical protein ACU85U_10660 [Gammaproteobacteria bacterium]|jgi:hypothetical protein
MNATGEYREDKQSYVAPADGEHFSLSVRPALAPAARVPFRQRARSFTSAAQFTHTFKVATGLTPSEFRAGHTRTTHRGDRIPPDPVELLHDSRGGERGRALRYAEVARGRR